MPTRIKMGAGHINVSRAMDPALVYELDERQYATHVCSTLGEAALRAVSRNDSWRCSELPTTHPSNLNYPSITVPLQAAGFSMVSLWGHRRRHTRPRWSCPRRCA